MAIECTDPRRWGNVPGFDSDEETVERYLAHLDECEYHARLENRADEGLASAVGMARAQVRGNAFVLPGSIADRMHQRRETHLGDLRATPIRELSVLVDGVETARARAERDAAIDVQAAEGAVVSVWGIGTDSNLFLSSCVVTNKRRTESATLLAGGQTIAFRVDPRSSAPARVSVAFAPSVVGESKPATRAGVLERASAFVSNKGGRWAPVYGLAAAALTIAVFAPIYFMQHDVGEPPIENALTIPDTPAQYGPDGAQERPPGDAVAQGDASASGYLGSVPEDQGDKAPARAGITVPNRPSTARRHRSLPPLVTSVTAVRRIYIPPDVGTPEVRKEIASHLRASGKFELVGSPRMADATLRLSATRGFEQRIAVWLDNRNDELIWNSDDLVLSGDDGPAKAAETFVKKLVEATEKRGAEKPEAPDPEGTKPPTESDQN
jgi:hypothetical protein